MAMDWTGIPALRLHKLEPKHPLSKKTKQAFASSNRTRLKRNGPFCRTGTLGRAYSGNGGKSRYSIGCQGQKPKSNLTYG